MSTHKTKGEDYYQCRDVKVERDKLLEEVAELLDRLESAEKERDAMRAKIEAMEKQEPVAWMSGISRVSLDFYWDSAKQHHIPTVLVEFEPVPVGSPNDAKGWQDRDRFAALTPGAKGE